MAKKNDQELAELTQSIKRGASTAWRAFRGLPTKVQVGVWAVLALVVLIANLTYEEPQEERDATANSSPSAADSPAPSEPATAPKLELVKSKTHCQQDFIVGNVDVVVTFRNTGDAPAKDVSVLPIREYADGREVRPIGDTMVDIDVPADGKRHQSWRSYGVGDGELIVGCRIKVLSDDAFGRDGEEVQIRVKDDG